MPVFLSDTIKKPFVAERLFEMVFFNV